MEASDSTPEATEAHPAPEQSPAATAAQKAITGDHGMAGQPLSAVDSSANTPVATSPPPPSAQPGVPLAEDREAGVEPGESSNLPGVQGAEGGEPDPEAGSVSKEEGLEAAKAGSLDPAAGTEAQDADGHVNPADQGTIS